MVLMFSHKLTNEQIEGAQSQYSVEDFIYLPEELQEKWANVPARGELPEDYCDGFKAFLEKEKADTTYVLIQGEWGVTYRMVNWCKDNGFIPVYSSSERVYESQNLDDNTVKNVHYFKHVNYKRY